MTNQVENSHYATGDHSSTTRKVSILLVDDKPENLLALGEVLENPEYNLVKATSGRAALRFLLKDEFAVVLLDVQMPGMDGFETAGLIRENARTRHIPVIFLTAKSLSAEDIAKGYARNAVDYIVKPFNPEILRTKVSVFVELHRKTAQLHQQTALLNQKIEKEKQAMEELSRMADRLTQSNTDLAQFAYVISHDLQEPLRMVASFLQLLAKRYEGKLDQNADEYIHFAVDGANRMREMIASILDYSRVNSKNRKFEWLDGNQVIDQVISDLRFIIEESHAEVTRDPFPQVWGDETQLRQVFQNLIGNAIKFRGDDPLRVHISSSFPENYHKNDQTPEPAGSKFRTFSVHDNGIGIEQQYAERIFMIFQRLHERGKYPGTGIGLAICKKIVERHGGRIRMESEPGKGTLFTFTLWEFFEADNPNPAYRDKIHRCQQHPRKNVDVAGKGSNYLIVQG